MKTEHDCVSRINGLLAEHNTVIAIGLATGGGEYIQIATAKADHTKRGKPVLFFASHCPFCGVKLNEKPATP